MNESAWEDNLLERKIEPDLKDVLKTLVAFANSVRPGHVAVLLIGERNDGTAAGVTNPDNIQKKVREEAEKIYPDILWRSTVYVKDGKTCVRVEIEFSGNTPHFGGQAWIRKGSETIRANDEVFQKLIDVRTDVITELSKWIGKKVTVSGDRGTIPPAVKNQALEQIAPEHRLALGPMFYEIFSHRWPSEDTATVLLSVNRFWVTFRREDNKQEQSEPLQKLTLSFDDNHNQPKIIVAY